MAECICKELKEMQNENDCLRKECEQAKKTLYWNTGALEKYKEDMEVLDAKNKSLEMVNESLKAEIQRLQCGCNRDCCCEQDTDDEADLEALICELQDQHQQDCIRINDLTTAISVLSVMYANLRKNAGMD